MKLLKVRVVFLAGTRPWFDGRAALGDGDRQGDLEAVAAGDQVEDPLEANSNTIEIDASHAVTVSKPDAVADLIHKAARATTP